MVKCPKPPKPMTPVVRRFLSGVFKATVTTPAVLQKQTPAPEVGDLPLHRRRFSLDTDASGILDRPACIALQNEDQDEDAVVITALNVVPFCCHADLLTMLRSELLAVADTLNARLPRVLHIDTGPTRSAAFIRRSIELLVGIRRPLPPTPQPQSTAEVEDPSVSTNPVSPTANRGRLNVSVGTPGLASVQEEDESPGTLTRPPKKRRCNPKCAPGTPTSPYVSRPITRSQSHRVAPLLTGSPARAGARVLRTHSQKLPERKPMLQGVHPNITTTRGRTGSRSGGFYRLKSSVMTSTPKRRRVLGDANGQSSAPAGAGASADPPGTPSLTPASVHDTRAVPDGLRALKRKFSDTTVDSIEVTFGIDGLTMPLVPACSGSDMDISTD